MKKYILLLVSLLLFQAAIAQDVIVKLNGDELNVKVLKVTPLHVVFRAPDAGSALQDSLDKKDIFMVRFANGTREVFQENLTSAADSLKAAYSPLEMYQLGKEHAKVYRMKTGPLNRAPALSDSIVVYRQDPNYMNGYNDGTRKLQSRKAAVGLGLLAGSVAFMLFLVQGFLAPGV